MLTDREYRHNLEITETAFGVAEGRGSVLILRSALLRASRRMGHGLSWFETALKKRLLTMRVGLLPGEPRSGVSKDGRMGASWFETARSARLLTMRIWE